MLVSRRDLRPVAPMFGCRTALYHCLLTVSCRFQLAVSTLAGIVQPYPLLVFLSWKLDLAPPCPQHTQGEVVKSFFS